MTVRPGEGWGAPGPVPRGAVEVGTDAEARSLVEEARRAGRGLPVLGLLGGDLCRTLGGTGDRSRLASGEAATFSVDVGVAVLDGATHWFVSHLLARRSPWRGRVLAAMNAEWIGRRDVAPRAHPGDGSLDLVDADLALGDRWKAWRRLPTGTHVPHPGIRVRRVSSWEAELDPRLGVWLDGEAMGRVRHLSIGIEPGALTVVV